MAHRVLRQSVLPSGPARNRCPRCDQIRTRFSRLRQLRHVTVNRSARSSVSEKSWKTAILRAAFPFTITCFILQFVLPTRHIALSTKHLFSMRLTIYFPRRIKMSSLCSKARALR